MKALSPGCPLLLLLLQAGPTGPGGEEVFRSESSFGPHSPGSIKQRAQCRLRTQPLMEPQEKSHFPGAGDTSRRSPIGISTSLLEEENNEDRNARQNDVKTMPSG